MKKKRKYQKVEQIGGYNGPCGYISLGRRADGIFFFGRGGTGQEAEKSMQLFAKMGTGVRRVREIERAKR
jgi:hypothetical protein